MTGIGCQMTDEMAQRFTEVKKGVTQILLSRYN
jgi:hypothetical protein